MRQKSLLVVALGATAGAFAVPSANAAPPEARAVMVVLSPGDAAVAVDGHPRQHPNGSFELRGPLGAVFTVEAVANGGSIMQRVAITDVGALPARLVVTAPPGGPTSTLPAPLSADFDECTQRTWRDTDGVKHYKAHCLFDDALSTPLPAGSPLRTIPTGALSVVCAPKCDHIFDNGTDLGPGHLFNHPAAIGAHALSLSSANGVKKTVVVEVVAEQLREVRVSMSRGGAMDTGRGALQPDPPDPFIAPAPAPSASTPTAVPAPAPTSPSTEDAGFLTLASYPWTKVSENGRSLCVTPCVKVALAPGLHVLSLDNAESGLTQLVQVTIKSGETTVKRLAFK